MRKPIQIQDLQRILDLGGGVSVDATDYELHEILYLVSYAARKEATVILRNAHRFEMHQLGRVASEAKNRVIFEV